jgi:hypothetical protein
MQRAGESIWAFWWTNFGLMGILFVALPLVLLRPAWRHYLVWYLPFLAILIVSQVYAFQPFEYDNLKLIDYVYLIASLFAGLLAVQAYRTSRWTLALLLPAAFVVTSPGLLSLSHEFQLRDQFADNADVALAGWVRSHTAPDAVFIGSDRPTQPVATLGGRPVGLGYRGWLFAWNLPYTEREAAVRAAFQGRIDDPMVRKFHPDYLVVAASEDSSWALERSSLVGLPIPYHNAEWTVYRLTGAATSDRIKTSRESR